VLHEAARVAARGGAVHRGAQAARRLHQGVLCSRGGGCAAHRAVRRGATHTCLHAVLRCVRLPHSTHLRLPTRTNSLTHTQSHAHTHTHTRTRTHHLARTCGPPGARAAQPGAAAAGRPGARAGGRTAGAAAGLLVCLRACGMRVDARSLLVRCVLRAGAPCAPHRVLCSSWRSCA
jgi:hypothetical protein